MKPTFSVIIPTKDRQQQLSSTLEKLVEQLDPLENFEVIVINDGGREPEYPHARVFIHNQANAGPAAARNKGASLAEGDFLIFLDDDCVPQPGWLAAMCREALAAPGVILAGRVQTPQGCNDYTLVSEHIVLTCQSIFADKSVFGFFLRPCNLCVSADIFKGLGGFNEEFRVSEDREFSERCMRVGLSLQQSDEAVVVHYKDLTFASFWKAHFHYGKGAYYFHRWIREQGGHRFRLYHLHFYAKVFLAHPRFAPLLLVWQVANLAGFLTAWFESR